MFKKKIQIGAIAVLTIEAEPGGAVLVTVQSGPFRALFPLSTQKVETITEALMDARLESERKA